MPKPSNRSVNVLVVCAAACGFLGACIESQSMPVGEQTFAARPETYPIDVYMPLEAPVVVQREVPSKPLSALPASARTIGRVDTQGAQTCSWTSLFEDARKRARLLGGDALVVRRWGTPVIATDIDGNSQYGKALAMEVVRLGD
jgi:hypothetical protein